MRGRKQDELQRLPPSRRRRSRFSSVILGMVCGVVAFGGMLLVVSELAPSGGNNIGAPKVTADDAKPETDKPALSLGKDETKDVSDGAGPVAADKDADKDAATGATNPDPNANDTSNGAVAPEDTTANIEPSVEDTGPENIPAAVEVAPEIELSGPANRVNAREFTGPVSAGLLSVVLYGGSDTLTTDALKTLSMPLTLALRSDRPAGIELAKNAIGLGYEVLAVLPLAVADQNTAGRLTDNDAPDRLENGAAIALASMRMAVGAVAPVGAQMLDRPEAMTPLLKPVAEHSFLWVEPQPSSRSAAARMAAESDLIFLQASVYAGPGTPEQLLAESIEKAAQQARARGTAVLFLEASPEAMRALWKWSLERREPGVVLAPISAVAKKRGKG